MDSDLQDKSDDGGFAAAAENSSTAALNNASSNNSPTAQNTKNSRKQRNKASDEESEKSYRSKKGRKSRDRDRDTDYDSDRSKRSHRRSRADGERERSVNFGASQNVLTTDSEREEVIEVQIMQQDDNWGDNTTAVTSGTSERSWSDLDITRLGMPLQRRRSGLDCHKYFGYLVAFCLCLGSFLSPVAFVIIPSTMGMSYKCDASCDGLFISMGFKLFLLAVGSWALFYRKPRYSLPRLFVFRVVMLAILLILLVAYWLFYGVRVIAQQGSEETNYPGIVHFAVSFIDTLLFVHYVAIIVLELRQLQPAYMLKVVRSPDGASRYYTIGQLSIQRAAVWILEQYYRDFQIYNPHLLHVPTSRTPNKMSKFKFYSVDGSGGGGNDSITGRARAVIAAEGRRKDAGRNDRFYEEQEYDRRVKKRKARLEIATEDAFTHIKRLHEDRGGHSHVMDPTEAAQAIFPSIARALQKYLRVTRQQPRWSMDTVIRHLATCISYNMAPKAFLEAFFVPGPPVVDSIRESSTNQAWELVSDTLVTRSLYEGTTFQLRHREINLQIYVMKIPHFKLTEEAYDYKNNRFTLRLQSETSV